METKIETVKIYEYSENYWIIEESCQLWSKNEGPTEQVALVGSLPRDYASSEMGKLSFLALDNFNSKKPEFSPWQLKESRKQFCSWVGARGWPSFYKNARYIWVSREVSKKLIKIFPVDNCNMNSYESPLENFIIETSSNIDSEEFGNLIREAFTHATSHPERKK